MYFNYAVLMGTFIFCVPLSGMSNHRIKSTDSEAEPKMGINQLTNHSADHSDNELISETALRVKNETTVVPINSEPACTSDDSFEKKISENNDVDVKEIRLQNEADVPSESLFEAAKSGRISVLQSILDKGAKVDAKNNDGFTTLHTAAYNGHKGCIELLIKRGAAVDTKTSHGFTALHTAAYNGHTDCVELLIKRGTELDAKNDYGFTALHLASQNGHKDCVELLIDKGAKVDAKTDYGFTALHTAAYNGHHECVELLIKRGAELDAKTCDGFTALHLASQNGHKECVATLLKRYIDLQEKNNNRSMFAVSFNWVTRTMSNLLKGNTDVGAKTNNGETALDLAVTHGHEITVEVLAKESRITLSKSSFLYAVRRGMSRIIHLLLHSCHRRVLLEKSEGYDPLVTVFESWLPEHSEIVSIFFASGGDAFTPSPSLLKIAAKGNSSALEAVEFLMKKSYRLFKPSVKRASQARARLKNCLLLFYRLSHHQENVDPVNRSEFYSERLRGWLLVQKIMLLKTPENDDLMVVLMDIFCSERTSLRLPFNDDVYEVARDYILQQLTSECEQIYRDQNVSQEVREFLNPLALKDSCGDLILAGIKERIDVLKL